MRLIKDITCFVACMICLIFYAIGALSIIPFIVFFILLFRLMLALLAVFLMPLLYIIEKTSNTTFKVRTVKRIFEYTLDSIYNDWRYIRQDLLDL